MAEEAEAGDVGWRPGPDGERRAAGRRVQRAHRGYHRVLVARPGAPSLDPRSRPSPRTERLGEHEAIAGDRLRVREQAPRIRAPGHRESVLHLVVDHGVAARR
jgi:hypothetical protein